MSETILTSWLVTKMKKFRKKQVWKACKMNPAGERNWIRKQFHAASGPWLSLAYAAVDLILGAAREPQKKGD